MKIDLFSYRDMDYSASKIIFRHQFLDSKWFVGFPNEELMIMNEPKLDNSINIDSLITAIGYLTDGGQTPKRDEKQLN